MKIPSRFTLGGVRWSVVEVPLVANNPITMGNTSLMESTVSLMEGLKDDVKGQTFCHELVHAILFSMGKMEHDEQFVDGFASYLYQYLKQQK